MPAGIIRASLHACGSRAEIACVLAGIVAFVFVQIGMCVVEKKG